MPHRLGTKSSSPGSRMQPIGRASAKRGKRSRSGAPGYPGYHGPRLHSGWNRPGSLCSRIDHEALAAVDLREKVVGNVEVEGRDRVGAAHPQ